MESELISFFEALEKTEKTVEEQNKDREYKLVNMLPSKYNYIHQHLECSLTFRDFEKVSKTL